MGGVRERRKKSEEEKGLIVYKIPFREKRR